jgi:SAM-dependent methyltransferase
MKDLGLGSSSLQDVMDYWNRRPCNIRHSRKDVGTKEYFDEVEARKYMVEPHIPGFADFNSWRGKRVLEIGCGIGTDAINFIRAGADYTGTDLSEESVALTKKRLSIYGVNAEILHANGEELDLPKKFDLIYSFGVIHHSPNPRKIIERAHALCNTGATLKMMLYAKNSWKTAMIESGLDQPEAQTGCPIAFSLDKTDVIELISGLFSLIEYRQDHIFPYVIEKYINFEYELQPWFKAMPVEMYDSLCAHFGWHGLITAVKR